TPENIQRLMYRCLQKDPKLRHRDMGDARLEITEAWNAEGSEKQSATKPMRPLAWLSALVAVLLIAVAARLWLQRTSVSFAPLSEMRFEITTPQTTDALSLAISPDGQKIVFAGTSEGRQRLWLR